MRYRSIKTNTWISRNCLATQRSAVHPSKTFWKKGPQSAQSAISTKMSGAVSIYADVQCQEHNYNKASQRHASSNLNWHLSTQHRQGFLSGKSYPPVGWLGFLVVQFFNWPNACPIRHLFTSERDFGVTEQSSTAKYVRFCCFTLQK